MLKKICSLLSIMHNFSWDFFRGIADFCLTSVTYPSMLFLGFFLIVVSTELVMMANLILLCKYDLGPFQFLITKFLICGFISVCTVEVSLHFSELLAYMIHGDSPVYASTFINSNSVEYANWDVSNFNINESPHGASDDVEKLDNFKKEETEEDRFNRLYIVSVSGIFLFLLVRVVGS